MAEGHAHEHGAPARESGRGHDHGHDHEARDGGHAHDDGLISRFRHALTPHSHDTAAAVDSALEASDRGMRTLFISLAILGATAAIQAVVAVASHSVALLGDTLHNVADALTALPLGLAFWLGRRPANRRYTYGYGRSEDLAGIVIVVLIAASSALAAYEAVHRLLNHHEVQHLWAVAIAAVVGFFGNEIVARYRINVGREIGSAALVADGLHARTDGFTSLSVLVGAAGVAIGWDWADPAVGLFITLAILVVLRDAAREVYRRLMDSVDPDLVDKVDEVLRATDGVQAVGVTRLRWIGHQLRAECEIVVDETLTIVDAHHIAEHCQHRLLHEVPRLTAALVHADPAGDSHHELTAHHLYDRERPSTPS
ncbi:MAG TPA: cation diffusion facilitator family transporter [Mycobacteriales bacterium]|nr:cation diffusion facilitator family transporter [Mycobacteriales bacterium]